jgi:hypothetical protein
MNATTQVTTTANGSALDAATLVARLKKAGEAEVLGAEQAEIDSYFDTKQFRFHAPDGFDTDFAGLNIYFKAVRAGFDDRSIRREVIVVQGDTVACQTWIEGTFAREFTQSGRPPGNIDVNRGEVAQPQPCLAHAAKWSLTVIVPHWQAVSRTLFGLRSHAVRHTSSSS